MALADNALTTLDTIKNELGITDTSEDVKLERLINAVSGFIQKYTGQKYGRQTKTVKLNGSGEQYLMLEDKPIISISSITYGDLTITDYELEVRDSEIGAIFREEGWSRDGIAVGLVGDPAGERRNFTVEYTYGYVLPKDDGSPDPRTLPHDLEQLAIELVVRKYQISNLEAYGLSSLKQGRITYTFSNKDLDYDQKSVLNSYRKLSF